MTTQTAVRIPSYRRHKPTGQAVVTLAGRDFYLGRWNTKASRAEYNRLIGEWLAADGCLPGATQAADLTMLELVNHYRKYAARHHVKDGRATDEPYCIRSALRPVLELYGHTAATNFGPLALKAIARKMVDNGLSRSTINGHLGRIRRMFRWAASEELLPVSAFQALATVPGLQRGRTAARETAPVLPVDDAIVEATLPRMRPVVAAMVRLQSLTGARPGEVCILRPCDVDATGDVWSYRPESHKTEHHGRDRVIFLGPKAQDVLRPFLLREKTAYCFNPTESEQKRNAEKREQRRSPMTPSQAKRKPKRNRRRPPGDCYNADSYRRAIERACDLAFPAAVELDDAQLKAWQKANRWSPNRLRHAAATKIRQRYGLEAAQVTLGHSQADVTQIYAERDWTLAAKVMREVG